MLLESGRQSLAASGYAGSRLADITSNAGLTTGAFYRHFASKWDFFLVLHSEYGAALLEALATARTLREQMVAWIEVARQHRGVVRASQELTRAGSPHLAGAKQLRSDAARLISRRMDPAPRSRPTPGAALMIVDILAQYAFMDAAEWVPARDPDAVARPLERLVRKGLYR